jgi:predicted flavoprotein YhiN
MATGSILLKKDIITKAFQASNCGYEIDWKPEFIQNMKEHLKKHYYFNNVIQKGEAIITKFGLEGNSIYGLSPQIRKQLDTNSKASIFIDFKPSLTLENIHSKIKLSKYRSTTDILKRT